MAEATGAKENQQKPEVVQLGQRFHLFNPEKRSTLLELPSITSPIPIIANFESIRESTVSISFVPFDPEIGYQLTTEDLDAVKRRRKLDDIRNRNPNTKVGLFLFSLEGSPDSPSLKKEDIAMIKNLRVQLFFPYGSYEAQVKGEPLERGKLSFNYFYPLDFGPLPQLDENDDRELFGHPYLHKGYWILLPRDMNKLSQIEARFFLAPEQQQDRTSASK